MNAVNKQKLRVSTKRDDAFIIIARGYKNWKRGQQDLKLMKPQNVIGKQLKLLTCQGNVQVLERNYPLTILRKNPKTGKFSQQSCEIFAFLPDKDLLCVEALRKRAILFNH